MRDINNFDPFEVRPAERDDTHTLECLSTDKYTPGTCQALSQRAIEGNALVKQMYITCCP